MSGRRRILVGLLALAAGGVLPAVAVSETTPMIEAVDSGIYGAHHSWSPTMATVSAGGVVTISNPSTTVPHGVQWVNGPTTPSCTGNIPVGTSPSASGTKWSGNCTFSQAGTYTFYCTVHGPEMTGTITVNPNGTTTTTTTTTTPPPGGGPSPPPSTTNPASGSPSATGSPLIGVTVPSSQRGKLVHGSADVSQAGVGGRLEVALSAGSASVARARRPAQVGVGRLVRAVPHAGAVSFAVPLSAKARRALARHQRLALTVKVILVPVHGSAVGITRSVVLHR